MFSNQQGNSFIELIVAVAIMAIFAVGAMPDAVGAADTANEQAARQELDSLRQAILAYEAFKGSLPAAAGDLVGTFIDKDGKTRGPLLKKQGWTSDIDTWKDPWKTRHYGWTGGSGGSVGGASYPARTVVCAGKDKTFGTADDITLQY